MNVLVAEDDDITRLLLGSALSKLGQQVHEATDGRGAWEAWQQDHYSLVISDWMMPDVDGLEFCRRIRAERRADYTYVLLLERRVTERTAELAAALRVKSEFLSRASHELRTPMNHVLGFARLLELDSLTAEQPESVQQILTSGRHLLELIDRILAVSKFEPDDVSFLESIHLEAAAKP